MKTQKKDTTQEVLGSVLSEIKKRREQYQEEFKKALEEKRWSHLPGIDGMDVGLLIAENIVESHITNCKKTNKQQ